MFFEFFQLAKHWKNKLKVGFETGSNLSLGTCLTKVKRLSRKRCCDTTPDRCQEGSRLTKGVFLEFGLDFFLSNAKS